LTSAIKAGSSYSIIYSYLFDAQLQGDDEAKNYFFESEGRQR